MNVATLELCKELHALSGWEVGTDPGSWYVQLNPREGGMFIAPKYNLGYLLRKLPRVLDGHEETFLHLRMVSSNLFGHCFYYEGGVLTAKSQVLEDAAAKLAIELFKQGILTKAGDRE